MKKLFTFLQNALLVCIAIIGTCSGIAIASAFKGLLFTGNFPYNMDTFICICFVGLACLAFLVYMVINAIKNSIEIKVFVNCK